MSKEPVVDKAGRAKAERDVVHLEGPSDIDIALTPEAALQTAQQIDAAAVDAILNRNNNTE